MKINKLLSVLAVATLPFLASCDSEAERAPLEKERAPLEKERPKEALQLKEKDVIRIMFWRMIFPSEKDLTEIERSRGWALLRRFGEEQMPTLTMRCKKARMAYLEAEANLGELVNALKAESIAPHTNNVFLVAERRWFDLAVEYWYLRYKLTDFYSQFKIGAITPDELSAKDAEFAEE